MMLFTSRGRSLFAALGIEPSQIQMGKREITTTNNTGGIENRERPEPNLHDRIPDPHFSIGAFPIWKAIRSTVREPSSAAIDHCFYIGRKIRQCLIHHRYPQCVCVTPFAWIAASPTTINAKEIRAADKLPFPREKAFHFRFDTQLVSNLPKGIRRRVRGGIQHIADSVFLLFFFSCLSPIVIQIIIVFFSNRF